ncbi:hypothetical protein CsSME_00027814 [Camellia sinensis var. sinensis]
MWFGGFCGDMVMRTDEVTLSYGLNLWLGTRKEIPMSYGLCLWQGQRKCRKGFLNEVYLLAREDDYRLFCGDLGNEVNDDVLSKAFSRFPSFNMARVVRDKRTGKTKGYGFVSFANPLDLAAALKEMNGKYVGNRPIKLRKSNWRERTDHEALERQKNHSQRKPKLSKKSVLHK